MSKQTLKDFILNGGDRSVQDIMSCLKFISKIKVGDVVDVGSRTLMKKCISTSLYRTMIARKEGRGKALDFFRVTIGESLDVASEYLKIDKNANTFYKDIATVIINSLNDVKKGIINHSKTYAYDCDHVSKIETLLDFLDIEIKELVRIQNVKIGK